MSTGSEAAEKLSGIVPEFYYDLIARFLPGFLVVMLHIKSRGSDLTWETIGVLLPFAYLLGVTLDFVSDIVNAWTFDAYVFPWFSPFIRTRDIWLTEIPKATKNDQVLLKKKMAESVLFRSILFLAVVEGYMFMFDLWPYVLRPNKYFYEAGVLLWPAIITVSLIAYFWTYYRVCQTIRLGKEPQVCPWRCIRRNSSIPSEKQVAKWLSDLSLWQFLALMISMILLGVSATAFASGCPTHALVLPVIVAVLPCLALVAQPVLSSLQSSLGRCVQRRLRDCPEPRQRLIQSIEGVVQKLPKLRNRAVKEAPTRTLVVDPLLAALGWDVRNSDEVHLDYTIAGGSIVDYALQCKAGLVLLVDAEPIDDPLNEHQGIGDILRHAETNGIPFYIRTNGIRWCVYRTTTNRHAPERLMFEVNLDPIASSGVTIAQLAVQMSWLSLESLAKQAS